MVMGTSLVLVGWGCVSPFNNWEVQPAGVKEVVSRNKRC